jgi:hypothetical protein
MDRMCCFSGHVEAVWNTRIFARRLEPGRQALVYAMGMTVPQAMAMVLPLPVLPGSPDGAVQFIDLQGGGKASFFVYLDACFPQSRFAGAPQQARLRSSGTLEVHHVGAFVASFVPSRADFSRLDARFRMPDAFWSSVPTYADWGFAVFQLAAAPGPRVDFHPLAFTFPTREKERLFFPTLHVHDGKVQATAAFDHTLYAQGDEVSGWERSLSAPHANHVTMLAPLLDATQLLSRVKLQGKLANRDTYVTG